MSVDCPVRSLKSLFDMETRGAVSKSPTWEEEEKKQATHAKEKKEGSKWDLITLLELVPGFLIRQISSPPPLA